MNILILTVNGIWHSVVLKSPVAGSFTESRDKEKVLSLCSWHANLMGLRVLYLTLEMGACDDFVNSVLDVGISSKTNNIIYSDEATIKELDEYLSKQRSPDVIMIDSIQYFEQQGGAKAPEIIRLRKKYPRKIFVFISHVDGREVEGKTAYDVKRDSFKRIYVEHFKATFIGRGKGGSRGYYIVWAEGYQKHWIENIKSDNDGTEDEETYQ